MKHTKLLSLLALLLALSLLLCACKSKTDDAEEKEETFAPTKELYYELNEGGETYSVRGCTSHSVKKIVIPSTHEGKPVTGIDNSDGEYGLQWGNFTEIVIPDSITSISWIAWPTEVKRIEKNVSYVENWVVDCDTNVTSIVIRSDIVGIAEKAFNQCEDFSSLVIPDGVKYINDRAFWYCKSLENIQLPRSIENIGSCAFDYCKSLKTITYQGTKAEWDMISKGDRWQGDTEFWESEYTFTVKCTDGEIIIER